MKLLFAFLWLVFSTCFSGTFGQEALRMPTEPAARDAVFKASEWLVRHIQRGRMKLNDETTNLSVIAWKDPTLSPDKPNRLAGYAITDSLWASYALTTTHPEVAGELHQTLKTLGCLSNNLHEVLWQSIPAIHHKPIDSDIVHGRSLGIMSAGAVNVDIRSFTMAADPEFEIGHPSLFVEHAAYQSLFEFRNGKVESAKNRLRRVFLKNSTSENADIQWDAQHKLLVDFVIKSEYANFISGETDSCRQYSFKLATLLYACRLMELDREFPEEIRQLEQRLRSVQLSDGGIPHFYDVEQKSEVCKPCPDATGEATAIFILAETVSATNKNQ
jgi:hypothetical protein